MRRFVGRKSVVAMMFLSCLAMCSYPAPAAAQSQLDGYWDLRTPNPSGDGTVRDTFFELQQKGTAVTGELIRWHHAVPLSGTLDHGTIHFATQPAATAPSWELRPIVFDGTLAHSKLKLTRRHAESVALGVATQVTEEATQPPKPLPLPALHDYILDCCNVTVVSPVLSGITLSPASTAGCEAIIQTGAPGFGSVCVRRNRAVDT
jgi:hypothetical protein